MTLLELALKALWPNNDKIVDDADRTNRTDKIFAKSKDIRKLSKAKKSIKARYLK